SIKELAAQRNIAAVYMDKAATGPASGNIIIDYAGGMRQACDHLAQLGHKRVAFLGGPARAVTARERKSSFLIAAQSAALELCVVEWVFRVGGVYFSCGKLLGGFDATAIIAMNDLMAIGALHYAYDRGIAVPGRLSIIGFDDILFAQ